MPDREKVIKGLKAHVDGCGYRSHHCDAMECPYRYGDESCDIEEMCHDALALLKEQQQQIWERQDQVEYLTDKQQKEQEEQKRKWLQTIADTQLAISPTGYESEDELAKRGWEWNGLQIAWEIIAGEERSEHPRLVRCKDCKNVCMCDTSKILPVIPIYAKCTLTDKVHKPDWFCADGERNDALSEV